MRHGAEIAGETAKRQENHAASGHEMAHLPLRPGCALRFEAFLKLVRRHADVAEDFAERADGERPIAVNGHDGIRLTTVQDMVTAANPSQRESLTRKKTQHVLTADAREPRHGQV